MKIALLGGGNPHALAFARHFATLGIDCFGIGRAPPKPAPLWLAPIGYKYHAAHIGSEFNRALTILYKERPDVIVCIAAQGEGAASFGESWRFYDTNCAMLIRLVGALRQCKWLKRFIQISTSELYGSNESPVSETAPVVPTSPYALSKATFDAHLHIEHRINGFPAVIVRPSNCYVEGQQLHRIIPRAAIAAVYGGKLMLQGGGTARKSYLHTDDLARAVALLIDKGSHEVYNVGPDAPVSIREVVDTVCKVAGKRIEDVAEDTPQRLGEDSTYWLESSKVKALGWKQTIGLEEGVARMVEWVKSYPELATMQNEFRMQP